MSNFYNKYKRLFTEKEEENLSNNRSQFINLYNDLNTPKPVKSNNLSNVYEDRNNKKIQKLGRSPALDEFERHILPRLKTEPESINIFRQAKFQHSSSKPIQRLPKLIPLQKPQEKKVVPNYVGLSPVINKQYEQELIKYYKRSQPKHYQSSQPSRINRQLLVQSLKTQPTIKIQPQIFQTQKQRNNQIMSISEPPALQKSRKNNLRKSRQEQVYQSQLYGINENPYAFANSKLNDIKQIQKTLPRGLINDYQRCLLNRLQKKKLIKERREKLKVILQRDISLYNGKRYPN